MIEDFEDQSTLTGLFENGANVDGTGGTTEGEIQGVLGTSVGTFTTIGPIGNGSTCGALDLNGDNCTNIALQEDPGQNGQGNLVPAAGDWSINSNDTLGVIWQAALAGGTFFDSLVFAIQDAADAGAKKLAVSADGVTETFDNLGNGNESIVVVSFGTAVNAATVNIETSANDGFTIDGAAISPVPLPASSLLLIGGMAALAGVARRRKNKKA
ncbi:VPLPA-CTERM sorting domain-containing protein [Roseobacter denitrificans]|uniref:VPLPA-CTERM sorting domain-containing protein n=1 Tax=Roseobacter denitrificans TaxID=2434 RepID=UPI00209B18AA|nr:VPLPA-CTERM sorting domain-containing protein [Roseobacter denitrificans]